MVKVATCQNLTFTEPTMVAEWGLVCDRNWQSKVENTSTIIEVLSSCQNTINFPFNSISSLYTNTIEGHHVNPDVWLSRRCFCPWAVGGQVVTKCTCKKVVI